MFARSNVSPSFRATSTPRRRHRVLVAMASGAVAVSSAGVALTAGPVQAASVTSAAFSGGAGTFTAGNGTVYAKSGAALTLTVNTDPTTQCVDVIDGAGATIATLTS